MDSSLCSFLLFTLGKIILYENHIEFDFRMDSVLKIFLFFYEYKMTNERKTMFPWKGHCKGKGH